MAHHPLIPLAAFARLCCLWLLFHCGMASAAGGSEAVYLEAMTFTEVRAAVAHGSTTVLVPIGGTEQNGPHMALGKHNVRVKALAGQIAQKLGNAIVAPVLAYVPEGSISPPAAHMRFSGTLSIPEATFESLLEATARSFKQHGFRDVVFLGDHGGYQKNEVRVAEKLNREWAADSHCRVLALTAYYEASQAPYAKALRDRGYTDAQIGTHAGLADTSLMLAIDPSLVRMPRLAEGGKTASAEGVSGDPTGSSAELGQLGVHAIVERSVQAIQDAVKQHVYRK